MDNESLTSRMAREIVLVLKYNPELSESDKVLAVESRLILLAGDIERSCAEAHKRAEDNRVIVDSRPQDIPELAKLIISSQRGLAN